MPTSNNNNYYNYNQQNSNQQYSNQPQYSQQRPYFDQQPFSTQQQPRVNSSGYNNPYEQFTYQPTNNASYYVDNQTTTGKSKKNIIIGISLIIFAFLFLGAFLFFSPTLFGKNKSGNIIDTPNIASQFADVETVGGTQGLVANSLEMEDEDYWVARVTSQDVESWSVPGNNEDPNPTATVLSSVYEPEGSNSFFPQSKIMYSQLDMSDDTRYVMNALRHAAETGKIYDNGDYSTYEYYPGGFRYGVDFAYDSFDYNMSDYPLTLAYLASPDFMQFYYSEKGFFMFDSGLFSRGVNFQQMYREIDDRAQAICDECWEQAGGDERQFISNVYHYLAQNMTYSDGINDTVHANDIYGALLEGESKCAGMSGAMKYILDKKGIPNIVGFSDRSRTPENEEGHAWNIVYLDGQWLCCDLTIGSKLYSEYSGLYPEEDIRYTIDNTALFLNQEYYYSEENLAVSDSVYELERYAEQNIL